MGATDWNERWKSGDTPWDKGAPAPPLVEFLATGDTVLHRARRVLVPGCGSGHDVRELARHGIPATGLDISPSAIDHARAQAPTGDEDYVCGDLFEGGWAGERGFDAVWEHTCFCAIDPTRRTDYARAISRLLPPGGHLAGVFFLTPWDPGETAEGPPFATSPDEIIATLEPWFEFVAGRIPTAAYPGREGREWLAVFSRRRDPGVAEPGGFA